MSINEQLLTFIVLSPFPKNGEGFSHIPFSRKRGISKGCPFFQKKGKALGVSLWGSFRGSFWGHHEVSVPKSVPKTFPLGNP